MPTLPELGACLQVPVAEVVRMGEAQAKNPESRVYKAIQDALVQKLAAARAVKASEAKKAKPRVYIQHCVPPSYRFSIVSAFPNYDIRFYSNDMRSGAVAIAVSTMIGEYMLSKFNTKQGIVIGYGLSLKQIVMRNRDWVHLCVAGHSIRAQNDFFRDDRAVVAVTNSLAKQGKTTMLCHSYVSGEANVHCTESATCTKQGRVAAVLLNKTDTNFRQLAMFMRQHGTSLLYFGIPCTKEMELGVEGKFGELDAHVFPTEGGEFINVCYKNAASEDMTYRYANYLELIARTTIVIDGETFHKEFDNRLHGYAVYKITRHKRIFHDQPPMLYKSWIEPSYRDKYLVYVPVLIDNGKASNPAHWKLEAITLDKSFIDDMLDYGMRAQKTDDLAQKIESRAFSRTTTYSLVGQVVNGADVGIPIHLYDSVCLALYCGVFMRKYSDGRAVQTLAPHARRVARMANAGTLGVIAAYGGMVVGNLIRASGIVTDSLRSVYYDAVAATDLPLPSFAVCPGFVEYSDSGSSNPRFKGWMSDEYSATVGFSSMLPGCMRSPLDTVIDSRSITSVTTAIDQGTLDAMIATGEAYIAEDAEIRPAEYTGIISMACGWATSVANIINDVPDIEHIVDDQFVPTSMMIPGSRDVAVREGHAYVQVEQDTAPITQSHTVFELTRRIVDDSGGLRKIPTVLTKNQLAFVNEVPDIVPGVVSRNPLEDLRDAMLTIFPDSLSMVTDNFETDRSYTGWDVLAKSIRARLDVSKITGLKPESFYRPLLQGHVHPHVKDNFSTTFHSVNKRNFNMPAGEDAMDVEFLWSRAWNAVLKVFYVEGAEERLASLPYIGPDDESVAQWVSRLDDQKRMRLTAGGGFDFSDMFMSANDTQLMVKKKLKPTLDASYASSVKHPQTIQFDASGRSVATMSPIVAQKVARENELLKPNVFIMQGKSQDDLNKFLNAFDWRPNSKGVRKYIEVDYSQYDKSQGARLVEMYMRNCAKFGMLKDYITFMADTQNARTVAAMKAGLKASLRDQNQSGSGNTLDRNNDINKLVIAELLLEILDVVEFVVLMGDDIIIAVRGEVNVAHWELELNRKYNLTLKAATHDHGYICSLDICHLPDGHTRVVADGVKRALSFMDLSISDEDKFRERYVSYCDNIKGLEDMNVQAYLATALPPRMRAYLPTTTSDAVMMIARAHAALLVGGYDQWRTMFSEKQYERTY